MYKPLGREQTLRILRNYNIMWDGNFKTEDDWRDFKLAIRKACKKYGFKIPFWAEESEE